MTATHPSTEGSSLAFRQEEPSAEGCQLLTQALSWVLYVFHFHINLYGSEMT